MSGFNSDILNRLLDSSNDDFHQRIPDQQNSDYFIMFEKVFGMSIDSLPCEIRDDTKIDELNK